MFDWAEPSNPVGNASNAPVHNTQNIPLQWMGDKEMHDVCVYFTTISPKQPDLIGRAVIHPQDFMFCVSLCFPIPRLWQEFEISMLVQINELWTGCVTLL